MLPDRQVDGRQPAPKLGPDQAEKLQSRVGVRRRTGLCQALRQKILRAVAGDRGPVSLVG